MLCVKSFPPLRYTQTESIPASIVLVGSSVGNGKRHAMIVESGRASALILVSRSAILKEVNGFDIC